MKTKRSSLTDIRINTWAKLLRVSQYLFANIEADLKSARLPPLSWYDVLLELKRVDPKGLRPFQLQENLLIAQYNLSRLIDKLVTAGYVRREICKQDGRGHSLKITESGLDLQKQMSPIYLQAIGDHFSVKLEDSEMQSLDDILIKLQNH
ncbi:MAG: winged helix-turn-helix transcriptional regulator [Sneathiella sp.]|nr:winged helix-turn-helix transcriptional regulator [Sneathiella sp.]